MRGFFKAAVICFACFSVCLNVHASDLSGLREEKEQQEDKKAEAEAVVASLQSEQDNILAAIEELDNQVAEYNNQIADLENQKADLEEDIAEARASLADAQEKEQEQYAAMKLRIQYSYENGNVQFLDTIFLSSDISDIVNKSEYVEQIYRFDSNMLAELIAIRKTIADSKLILETDLAAVEEIEAEVTENREAVEIMIEGKQAQVANYRNSIEGYEAQIAQIEADIAATDAKIAEAEAAFAQQNGGDSAGVGDTPAYTGGKLQWPVSTGGVITSYFGPRDLFGRHYHYGLDIGCSMGTPILAAESGTVISAAYSGSMGNYVVIAHGNNMSTIYMHNSGFAVSVGQQVSRGQVIAYAGSTGDSEGPHCHIGVRVNGSYVDPLPYLQ